MQSVSKLASRLSGTLSPHLAQVVEKSPNLSSVASTLASQRIADPFVWSELLTLAETEPVLTQAEVSLAALTAGKFYHSRLLRTLTADFSAFASAREVLAALRVAERLPAAKTRGIFMRASEKLQTLEISFQEISDLVHVFRRVGDERLFAHVLKKIGKKISTAEISECVCLLENMGRAKLRHLRTINALVDKILRSEISGNFRSHVRMLHALDKLKIIYGRDRLLEKYYVDDISDLDHLSVLELVSAFNGLGADTRKFLHHYLNINKLQISDLPISSSTLRALCGFAGEQEISHLVAQLDISKETAEIFLAHVGISDLLLAWPLDALTALRDAVQAVAADRPAVDHVCALRMRNAVQAALAGVERQGEISEISEFMGCFVLNKRPSKRTTSKRK